LDQFYFESGYLEDRYFGYVANAEAAPYIQAEYIDRYFWQDGTLYIDAELIGEGQILEGEDVFADAFVSAAFTINCQGNVTFSAASTLSAEFTQQAIISHIEGADLFAFAEAQMAIEVSRLRDHDIVASTVFNVATDVVRIKQLDIDISSETTSSVEIERRPGIIQNISAAFSFNATTTKFTGIVSNLTTVATISCRVKLGITWINANGQPLPTSFSLGVSGAVIDNTTFNFGSGSLSIPSNQSNGVRRGIIASRNARLHSIPSGQTIYSISFWFRRSAGISQSRILHLGDFVQSDNFFQIELASGYMVIRQRTTGIDYIATSLGSFNLLQNTWYFIEFSAVPTINRRVYKLFVNGTEYGFGYGNNDTWTQFGISVPDFGAFISGNNSGGIFIDDYQYRVGSNLNGTVPTQRSTPVATTRTLLPFDSNFDDIAGALTITAQAALSSSAVINANVESIRIIPASATLDSEFIFTVDVEKLKLADADLDSESIVAADINVIADGLSNQTAETTIDLTVGVIRNLESELNTAAELSAIISHIEGADIVADSFAALDADVEKITESNISIQSEFAQDTDAERLLDGIAVFETTADIEISSVVIADAVSALNSEFAQDTDVLRLRDLSSSLDSESNLAVEVNYTAESPAQLDSESQLSTDAGRIQQGEIFTESVATKLAIVVKVGSVVLDMPVVSDLAVDIVGTLEAQADLASEFTFIGSGTGRAQAEAHLFAQALQVTDAEATKPFDSAMFSEFDIFARGIKDTELVLDIASESLLAADSDKFVGVSSDLLSEFTQTSTEDLFKAFDSALTSTVELDITAAKTASAESSIDSEFNLDCTISHIEGADIVADSFAELYIQYFVGKVGSGDLQAETEITVANDRIRDHDSSQTTEASIFAEILRLRDFSSDLTADTVQTAAVNAILSADSSSISTTELFCVISHIEGADIVADSFAELEITATVIKTANSDLIAAATLDAQAMVLVGLTSDQTVTATVAADAMVMLSLTGNLNSAFSQTALGGVIEQASADLVASGGLLAVGRDIRLDTKVYVIPPETRIYSIAAETRIDNIDSETRIFTIRSTR